LEQKKKTTFDVAYEEAFELGCTKLLEQDIESCCANAGAGLYRHTDTSCSVGLTFLNRPVTVTIPDFSFSAEGDAVHVWEKIIILHYLANAAAKQPLTGSLINYRQVKDGSTYFSTFEKRSAKPFLKTFGETPGLIYECTKPLGGKKVDCGDVGVTVNAFPLVPITFVIWKGDEEFPPEANILFDESIEAYLSAEDIAVLCQQLVFKIIGIKRTLG